MLEIFVKTNSKKDEVIVENDIYYVSTKKPAVDGKANDAVIYLLAKYLGLPKSNLEIQRGKTSKRKYIKVTGR
ncbi:DUF167 domain-containing protein [Candidatus Microgenomates bacterium]|nr:DUF167 domain-containing protein [Candidatus Microgenomates bacterium]